jgi:hypothetical protein
MRKTAHEMEQIPWPLSWNWLGPVMDARADYNAKLHEAFIALSREWQTFVGERIKEDLHLMREVGTAKTPEQLWNASARFWQKAAEDYAHEYGVCTRLALECVIPGVSAAGQALHAEPAHSLSKAA